MNPSRWLFFARCVFYLSLIVGCLLAFSPGGGGLHAHFNDKLLHAVGFMVMAFLSHAAHPSAKPYIPFLGLVVFGLLIEVIQGYLPTRSLSFYDWLADIGGLAIYFLLIRRPIKALFANYKYGLD